MTLMRSFQFGSVYELMDDFGDFKNTDNFGDLKNKNDFSDF